MRQLIVIGVMGMMLCAAKCDEEGGGCDVIEDDEAAEIVECLEARVACYEEFARADMIEPVNSYTIDICQCLEKKTPAGCNDPEELPLFCSEWPDYR
jgi:hypothetical protein